MQEQTIALATSPLWLPSRRLLNSAGFIICMAGLGIAYLYFQSYLNLDPCPLCIFQRLAMFVMGLIFLAAAIHNPTAAGARVYGVLIALTAAAGAAIAARHVWLQHLPPDQVPACGPTLEYMLETFPIGDTIRRVLKGSGDCAVIDWTFLDLSIPAWTLIMFIGLGLTGALRNWMRAA